MINRHKLPVEVMLARIKIFIHAFQDVNLDNYGADQVLNYIIRTSGYDKIEFWDILSKAGIPYIMIAPPRFRSYEPERFGSGNRYLIVL